MHLVHVPLAALLLAITGCSSGAASAPPATPRATVVDAQGVEPAYVQGLLDHARVRLEPCLGSSGGKVRLRLRSTDGRLTIELEPSGLFDAVQMRCALDALTATQADTTKAPWTGATVPPSGFTSLVTLDW